MIDPKQVVEGQRIQREAEKCKHPVTEIIDRQHGSYCKACKQAVPPPSTKPVTMDWMGRTKPSIFPVFPSGGE